MAEFNVTKKMAEQEGVIKFSLEHNNTLLNLQDLASNIDDLQRWRWAMHKLGVIGQQPDRYDGYGFGNISVRTSNNDLSFIISGTQTGLAEWLAINDIALVTGCFPIENKITSTGPVKPSSEAMTHGQVYQLHLSAHAIVHGHCPDIWQKREQLDIPTTDASVPYGTVEMAEEVARLFEQTDVKEKGIFAMAGHEDGIVTFGRTLREASSILIDYLSRAAQPKKTT